MHIVGLAILAFVGITSFAVLSVLLYASLPEAAFEYAARHGRFSGLEAQEVPPGGTKSGHPQTGSFEIILQGQTT